MTFRQSTPLVEWFAENYSNFGASLEYVTNRYVVGSPGDWLIGGFLTCFGIGRRKDHSFVADLEGLEES